MADLEFTKGFYQKQPHPNVPDFVKSTVRLKLTDAIVTLEDKQAEGSEWLDLDVKGSRGGKWYASVNTWQGSDRPSSSDLPEFKNDPPGPPIDNEYKIDEVPF